ncbi:30132_t:CDS:2, partial [Gigaspora margarita]
SYFKGEINDEKKVDKKEESLFTANMYLAEDRILCFELVAKRKSSWLLHYVKSSQAETDVPEDVTGLISQRRRWLNGSFFASFHAIIHFYYIWRSDHSLFRKIFLHVEMAYQAYNLIPEVPKPQNNAVNVETNNGKATVEFSMPEDINDVYNQALRAISQPTLEEVSIATPKQKNDDSRKLFRTMVVLLWIFSNALLIIIVTSVSGDESRTNLYMAIILWSVAGLAAFRFLGTTTYILFRLFTDPNALIFWK